MKSFRESAPTTACALVLGATWLAGAGLATAATNDSATQRILSYADMVKLSEPTEKQLEAAKAATQKYRDINVALAEGFVQGSPDVPGEGFHYVNPGRLDCKFDPAHPEILLYALLPDHTQLKLVAVEYAIPFQSSPGREGHMPIASRRATCPGDPWCCAARSAQALREAHDRPGCSFGCG